MKRPKPLETIWIKWNPLCCLPPIETLETQLEKKSFHEAVRKIEAKMSGFHPLQVKLQRALDSDRQFIGENSGISIFNVKLTKNAAKTAYQEFPEVLTSEVEYDPITLIDADLNKDAFGKISYDVFAEAIEKARSWKGFPFEVFAEELYSFAESGYCLRWIVGSKEKGKFRYRVRAEMSSENTRAWVKVWTSEDSSFEKLIYDEKGAKWIDVSGLKRVKLTKSGVEIGQNFKPYLITIGRGEFPEDIADHLGLKVD